MGLEISFMLIKLHCIDLFVLWVDHSNQDTSKEILFFFRSINLYFVFQFFLYIPILQENIHRSLHESHKIVLVNSTFFSTSDLPAIVLNDILQYAILPSGKLSLCT